MESVAREADEARRQEETKQHEQYVSGERDRLVEKMPELKVPEKAKAFYTDVLAHAEHYGFTREDVDQAYDHRLWPLMRDAIAYRKLQAAKPKVMEKARNAAPVKPPGRRQAPSEGKAVDESAAWEKLKRTGEFDDALALLNMRS